MASNTRKRVITISALATVLIGTVATVGFVVADDHKNSGRYSYEEETEIEVRMVPSEGFSQAEGTIEWSQDSDDGYTEFEVDIEYLPQGEYVLFIGGEQKGVIQARADDDNDGAEGELEFYSDGRDSAPLLDFDPFGQLIEVKTGDQLVLSVTMPEKEDLSIQTGASRKEHHNKYGADEQERWGLYLDNTGVYPKAKAMVELVIDEDGQELEVEVDNLPVGNYAFRVNGQEQGTLVVSVYASKDDESGSDETEGELGFSEEMDDEDDQPLDFEVKGANIEILEGNRVVFQGTFT